MAATTVYRPINYIVILEFVASHLENVHREFHFAMTVKALKEIGSTAEFAFQKSWNKQAICVMGKVAPLQYRRWDGSARNRKTIALCLT